MKKERKAGGTAHEPEEKVKSRKDLRKQKKQLKKQKKRQYFQARSNTTHERIETVQKNHQSNKTKKITHQDHPLPKAEPKKQKIVKSTKKSVQENEDDLIIREYEQKLGVKQGKDKYNKIAKQFGLDDDLFTFLADITKKTQDPNFKYSKHQKQQMQQEVDNQEENEEEEEEEEEEELEGQFNDEDVDDELNQEQEGENIMEQQQQGEDGQFDAEFDNMFDNLDQADNNEMQDENSNQQQNSNQQNQSDNQSNNQQIEIKAKTYSKQTQKAQVAPYRRIFKKDDANPEQLQIKKSMNGLFNKLSDGNILLSFRQLMKIIDNYPRSTTIPVFAELFVRFNLMIQKPLFHILATNVALLSALHYAVGNRLLGPVLHSLTKKYIELTKQKQDDNQVSQIGYSKRFQRMKNFITMMSLLYNYGSICGQFIQSLVGWLTRSLDKLNIELLYIIIQKCGNKVRQNDPSILKNIIVLVKESIQTYKKAHSGEVDQLQKINFIETQLNDIKFNKKSQQTSDQRMAFLQTFIFKNVPKQIQTEKQVFPLSFQTLINIDITRTNWWESQDNFQPNQDGDVEPNAEIVQLAKQKKQLVELAKSFHMVTEAKRNIFICLMDSRDYLEATQRILELRIRNYQDLATVLVQVCTLEPNFNPFYPLVAAKIASLLPKFRLNLQYAIWDHLKLISNYELRRTSNLAKFISKLITDPLSNCSLSILKFYPDLSNVRPIQTTFLNIFFTHFFKKVKKEYLSKLIAKLRQQNNRSVKEGIKQFLSQFECEQDQKQKLKLCRRLLMIQLDERKAQRGEPLL